MSLSTVSVVCEHESRLEEVIELSQRLKISLGDSSEIQLCAMEDKWAIRMKGGTPVWVDFDVGYWRTAHKGSKQEGLVRAIKPYEGCRVLDLTAGFGRDAAILSGWGASVVLVERDPIMQILLADGIKRGMTGMVLYCGEAIDYMEQLVSSNYPDVIYLDPMHPVRSKSAKVKKLMQMLQAWMKPADDLETLLMLARQRVRERVVIKSPVRQKPIGEPNHCIMGKTVRFDVYTRLASHRVL